jgi:2,4-dichlorophenol 6-monooxygenase
LLEQVTDLELHYVATTAPGARIPHVWLFDRLGKMHSTLDITGRGAFTLLTGIGGEAWGEAARKEAEARNLKIETRVIGPRRDYEDHSGDWARASEVSDSGCLLIRPDQHVAFRAQSVSKSADAQLASAFRTILGK